MATVPVPGMCFGTTKTQKTEGTGLWGGGLRQVWREGGRLQSLVAVEMGKQ